MSPPSQAESAPIALEQKPADDFKVLAETFGDVRILRYRVPGFEQLPLRKKMLLHALQEAALSGRDITYDQLYRNNLMIRRTLEAIVVEAQQKRESEGADQKALLVYLKRIWFSNGVHDPDSHRKFVPEGLTREGFAGLVRKLDPKALPKRKDESVDRFLARITPLIFDPSVDATSVNKDPAKDPVADSANNFYVGLTRAEVLSAMRSEVALDPTRPPSFGLNAQLRAGKDGVETEVYRVGGLYGPALEECVRWLTRASELAESDPQKQALDALIQFYRTGDLNDFDRYSVAWVNDTDSSIDLIHGFIETYHDPLGLRGTYEGLVELTDESATRRIRALSENAAWFEQASPIADEFKKEKIVGIHARVVHAVVAAGDVAPSLPIGVNLPNSAWIREQHGSKSVTLGNILAAYEAERTESGVLQEFAATRRERERARSDGALASALLVDMHEVIGHASGKLKPGVGDVGSTLGHYGSTLEEARADLVALYYLLDAKLVDLKVAPSLEVGRAGYDSFLRGALVQIASVPLGETLEEDHMRNHQLIVHWVFDHDPKHLAVERLRKDDKTFYVVRDYPRLRGLFGELLREIQRIKSEGDLTAARDLVETYGVRIEPELHKEVRARYATLQLPTQAGFMQPELVPVTKADQIVDVRIDYPTDFAAQQLRYSAKYSFLPISP